MAESSTLEQVPVAGNELTLADFERQQHYFREKLKRHNRSLHGFGIVSGLKVTIERGRIVVEPGLALDCEGNELAIPSPQTIDPPAIAPAADDWGAAYLNLSFVEASPAAVSATAAADAASILFAAESFELVVTKENRNRGHRHLRARWLACGEPHALTIAKLRRNAHGWRVDRKYRPPSVK
jgi:hypothetical protein